MVAEQEVTLGQVPVSGVLRPFQVTTDPAVKPLPAMATVTGLALPVVADAGVRLVMMGAAATVNVDPVEATPSELTTVIWGVPAVRREEAGTVASREVELPYQEVSCSVPNFTIDVVVKLLPAMVTDTGLVLPTVAVAGVRVVTTGAALMVNGKFAELTPSGVTTVRLALPAVAKSATRMVADMEVALI
jgi:hypothetical protein